MEEPRTFQCEAIIEKLDGFWVSHCPMFDIVSQGNSPTEAALMIREAVALSLADDLVKGLDPYGREPDEEAVARLRSYREKGSSVNGLPEADLEGKHIWIVGWDLTFKIEYPEQAQPLDDAHPLEQAQPLESHYRAIAADAA